ncbi:MAG: PDDEXK nuclease domain-containing protein [Deltaproteobacteria bacterium]|nr:PDDEXK nuclease domain-containing protein [Deltaproteobacteria bacterium]
MANEIITTKEYRDWLIDIKRRVRSAQLKAATAVNTALLEFYWSLGADIAEKQKNATWGSGFLKQLSKDLMAEFPDMKGFSQRNLENIRRWYLFYSQGDIIAKQPVSQLPQNAQRSASQLTKQIASQIVRIPWGHNIAIIQKCSTVEQALFYVRKTLENNWSRSVLIHQIESDLFARSGKAITNFDKTLPAPQSDLAREIIKDPYNFDFLTLTEDFTERELEKGLINHITRFLMELGAGFAYVGKQVPLQVGERDFFLDLLFYHTRLHCYVVIELKISEFEPEHAGKLNFYIKAVDEQLRQDGDMPTIGILLCKGKDRVVAEYALSDIHKPMGVSEYELVRSLPDELKSSLPTIEQIEAELQQSDEFDDE